MYTLTRYVLADFIKIFLISLSAMTLLMLIVGVVREGAEEGLGFAQIAQLIPYILPDALRFTVPGTVLFAACSLYGRMSGSNEIVAIKSLGISPMTILWPVVSLAFLLSLTTVWLNDLAVSWGRNGVRRVVLEAVEEIAYGMLRVHRSYTTDQLSITVKRIEGRRLIQPIFTYTPKDDGHTLTVTADEAVLESDARANVLILSCRNAAIDVDGRMTAQLDEFVHEISLEAASRRRERSLMPSWMPLRMISQEAVTTRQEIEHLQMEMAAQASYELLTGDFDALAQPGWQSRRNALENTQEHLYRLWAEPHRRWSNGFSCLCFVLVGAPMAIRLRNADFLTSFFICFLPILLVYYPFLVFFTDQAKTGEVPAYLVWLGNLVLLGWSGWLLRKVIRY